MSCNAHYSPETCCFKPRGLRTGLSRLGERLPSRGVEFRDTGRAGHRGHAPQECSWERRDGLFPDVSHFFQYFPFRRQVGPDSKLKARHTEIVSRKFLDPVTIRPNSSHVQFLEYRHASRKGLPRQKGPETNVLCSHTKMVHGYHKDRQAENVIKSPKFNCLGVEAQLANELERLRSAAKDQRVAKSGGQEWGIQKLQWLPQSSRRPNRRPIRIRFRAKVR